MIVRGWCLAERHRKGVGESHLVRLASVLMTVGGLITACQSAPPVLPVAPPPPAVPTASRPIPSSTDSRASYHFMLGYQAELEQNTEQAIKEYQLALQTDPTSHYIKARLAVLSFAAGDVPAAVRFADEVANVPGLDAQMLGQIGGMYAAAGKPDKALRLFNQAIEQEPQRSEHFFAKGLLQANQKQYAEAEETIRSGIKVSPDSAVGYYDLGRIGVEARDFDKAMLEFEQAVTLNPAFEPAYVALGSVYEAKQEREKAIGVYRRYLQNVNPKNREIRHHVIRLQVSAKQYDDALRELEDMLAEDPADLDAQLRMGLVYGEKKNYPKAIQHLNQILTARPNELKVRDYLGYLYEETKDYVKAVEAYRQNLVIEPSYFEGHLHLGVLQYRLKQYADAILHLKEASRLNPKQPEAHIVLGLSHFQAEQYEPSLQAFLEGIRHNPDNADLHFNAGTVYDKLNRFDDVVKSMETTLSLDPHHADALNYLGYSYAERGVKIEEAITLTKQAVALRPTNGYYVDSLAWAFFKKGLLAEALAEMKRAVVLVGDDPVIYEHLGEIYLKQQLVTEGREALLHSLELDPSNDKLMQRFRDLGLGDPTQEERIRQALRRVSDRKTADQIQ
ncbi:tetratricopeptide repeat protein [Nitrospirales bacterium NOB]|nr:tetratricopeptide repeat protein [Nitrospirales bacterium NOB]